MSTEAYPADQGRYVASLRHAIAFTRALECTSRTAFDPSHPIVTDAFAEIIREWAHVNICSRADDRIAGMCMQITHELVEFLRGGGVDAVYTLGWMSYRNHNVYRFGQEDVVRWLKHGIPNRHKVDVHAWVTLPSAEILDPSWLSTVGIVQNKRELIGAVIIADAEQRTSHQYHPITVDSEILFRIGLLNADSKEAVAQQAPPVQDVLAFVR